jgi:hypothetical protein
MKKFFASILAFLYLSTSMGATLHLHYCMGKLVSWGLINHETRNCEYCGMPKAGSSPNGFTAKKHCCQDEQKIIQTDKDQKTAAGEFQFPKLFPDASAVHFLTLPDFRIPSVTTAGSMSHAPPPAAKQPVFLSNCNFRI